MNPRLKLIIALTGCMSAVSALAREYEVQGVFADGGTFFGTFYYNARTNSFANSLPNDGVVGFGIFNVSIAGETSGIPNQAYADSATTCCNIRDLSSTPTQLVINESTPIFQTSLTLTWNSALNSRGGHANQLITGGDAMFLNCPGATGECFTPTNEVESQVIGGSITPLPYHNGNGGGGGIHAFAAPEIDPASALSGFTLIGACLAFMRGRRVKN